MLEALVFYPLAALIIGFGVLVVTARDPVHCVRSLASNFLCVAMIYVLLAAESLAVVQILVYAAGIAGLYLVVVVLINLHDPPDMQIDTRRQTRLGFVIASLLLAEMAAVLVYSAGHPAEIAAHASQTSAAEHVEAVGRLLYAEYLVPFAVASMLLIAAVASAIVLTRGEAGSA